MFTDIICKRLPSVFMLQVMREKVLLVNYFIDPPGYPTCNSHCGPKAISLACHRRGPVLIYATAWLCRDKEVKAFDAWLLSFYQTFIDESSGLLSLAERSFPTTPHDRAVLAGSCDNHPIENLFVLNHAPRLHSIMVVTSKLSMVWRATQCQVLCILYISLLLQNTINSRENI